MPAPHLSFAVEPAASGQPTLVAERTDGKRTYLHSTRDPVTEAERLARRSLSPDVRQVLAIGLGLGYHVAAACAYVPDATIYVIEPHAEVIELARQHGPALAADRVMIISGEEEEIIARLRQLAPELHTVGEVLIHPPSQVLLGAKLPQIASLVDVIAMQRQSRDQQEGVVPDNISRNQTRFTRDPDYDAVRPLLADGLPVVVTAGPSLNRSFGWLREHRARLRLVAADTVLPALLAAQLEPEIVVGTDPFPANLRHFADPGRRCVLAYYPSLYPEIVPLYRGRRVVVTPSTLLRYGVLRRLWGDRPTVTGGSSVVVVALELVQRLAYPGPVLITGADFGFPGGAVYARGSRFHKDMVDGTKRFATIENGNFNYIQRYEPIAASGAHGDPVLTHKNYFSFRLEFEAFLAREPRFSYYQLAGSGLAVRGSKPLSLAEATVLLEQCGR